MVSFEIFVKAMPPSLSELKVLPSFCFAFKIPDDVTATRLCILLLISSSEDKIWLHLMTKVHSKYFNMLNDAK